MCCSSGRLGHNRGALHYEKNPLSAHHFLGLVGTTQAQFIPKELWGKWIVRREVPTTTLSCWSEHEAKTLIGTDAEFVFTTFHSFATI
jgi:hypothetical protein